MNQGYEQALLKRVSDLSDHRAFEELFAINKRKLLYFIIGQGVSFHDAEDVLQETALQLFHYLRNETPTSFLAVALHTAKWKICDYRRKSGSLPMMDEFVEEHLHRLGGVDLEKQVSDLRTSLAILDQSGMSEVQREAVVLRYYVGCTISEVAAFANVHEDTAKARIRLAMKKVKAYLRRSKHFEYQP